MSDVIAALHEVDLHPSELRPLIAQIARVRNQLDSLETTAIRRADTSGQWAVDGSRSAKAWVERVTHCSAPAASARLRNARLIGDTPALAAVFAAGDTTSEHLSTLSRTAAGSAARRAAVGEVDQILAQLAPTVRPGKFGVAVARWAHRVDAVGVSDEYAKRSATNSYLHVSRTFNGLVAIDGILDPETGSALIDALTATRTHLRRGEKPADGAAGSAASESVGPPVADHVEYRRSSRNVDALRHLLGLALGSAKMPTATGGIPVQVTVTTTLETLRAGLDDRGVEPASLSGDSQGAGGSVGAVHCQIPAATARRLACDAGIVPVVLGGRSQVLDVGRKTRLISPALRLAIELRDQHCRWPGCEAGIREIHHIVFWSNGGATDRTNLAGLCRAHHHTVHERGFSLTGNADHQLTVQAP